MLDPSQIDGVVLRLHCQKRYLVNLGDDVQTDIVITQLEQVIQSLQEKRMQYQNQEGCTVPSGVITNVRGRPRFDIREETLAFFLENGFKVAVS